MRKKLIIHIGMHKTGSTAIQHYLSRNRLGLGLLGVAYPISRDADGRRQPKQGALFDAISHEADFGAPHPRLGSSSSMVEALARRIESARAPVAVISAEGFSGERPVFARALAPLGERFDVSIAAFLRRPDDWLRSFHRQMIMSRDVREARALAEFAADPATRAHLDFPRILSWWGDAFGADALRVARYEDAGDIVDCFFALAGLPRHLARGPYRRSRRNSAAPLDRVLGQLADNRDGGAARAKDLSMAPREWRSLKTRLQADWTTSIAAAPWLRRTAPFIPLMTDMIEPD